MGFKVFQGCFKSVYNKNRKECSFNLVSQIFAKYKISKHFANFFAKLSFNFNFNLDGSWGNSSLDCQARLSPSCSQAVWCMSFSRIATLGFILDSQLSWKLIIWEVAACKMEPQSGNISWKKPPNHMDFLGWIFYQIPSNGMCGVPPSAYKSS